jgi:WD40 repeat protein
LFARGSPNKIRLCRFDTNFRGGKPMRILSVALVLFSLIGLAAFSPADEKPGDAKSKEKVSREEIDRLIKQLGDDDFGKRVQAKKQLEAVGEPAIDLLKKAADSSSDAEVRRVAKELIEAWERKNSGLLRVLGGHRNRVNGVAISADGKRALSASWDGVVRYWDLEKGELIREMKGHQSPYINSVTLSANGKQALTGSGDRTMRLWDVETGKELRAFGPHPGPVYDVAFSPDGKKALSGCADGIARLWDLASGKELFALPTQKGGYAWAVAFTPDGKQGATGGGSAFGEPGAPAASLRLWDLTTGKEIRQFTGHTKDVRRIAISPDGKQLLSGSFDGTMRLWDLQTGKEIRRFDSSGHFVEAVAFTRDGKRIVCCYGSRGVEAIYKADPRCSLRLWDLAAGKEIKQFKGHTAPILCLALSADGRFLVSGSADQTMCVWQMPK